MNMKTEAVSFISIPGTDSPKNVEDHTSLKNTSASSTETQQQTNPAIINAAANRSLKDIGEIPFTVEVPVLIDQDEKRIGENIKLLNRTEDKQERTRLVRELIDELILMLNKVKQEQLKNSSQFQTMITAMVEKLATWHSKTIKDAAKDKLVATSVGAGVGMAFSIGGLSTQVKAYNPSSPQTMTSSMAMGKAAEQSSQPISGITQSGLALNEAEEQAKGTVLAQQQQAAAASENATTQNKKGEEDALTNLINTLKDMLKKLAEYEAIYSSSMKM